MYYPKLAGLADTRIHHKVYDIMNDPRKGTERETLLRLQLKQCRSGYYVIDGNKCVTRSIDKNFALKSAHDHDTRRSKDSQMYGYESLSSGIDLEFSVYYDDDDNLQGEIRFVKEALLGGHRIGRSRTAQYGEVNIAASKNEIVESTEVSGAEVLVYADARLIFLDENGLPTFTPKPSDFGLDDKTDKIVWEKSQLRTFQYAPWNFKRQAFDTDRCGLEKGSVIYIRRATNAMITLPPFVGSYQLEGFGHVVYNPVFLQANQDGTAVYTLSASSFADNDNQSQNDTSDYKSDLLTILRSRKEQAKRLSKTYQLVNQFVSINAERFISGDDDASFASQWGTIRKIAMSSQNSTALREEIADYLTNGVAARKWKAKGRFKVLNDFMQQMGDLDANHVISLKEVMVNLASEMGKVCSRK
jgi:hypothetical protein